MRDPEVRHREAMAGTDTTFFDPGESKSQALPVLIGSIVVAGDEKPDGLILQFIGKDEPVALLPLFLSQEEVFKIEAVLREARLQFPGCFQ